MINDLQKKQLEKIAKELGAKVDYLSCTDMHSTCTGLVQHCKGRSLKKGETTEEVEQKKIVSDQ